MKFKVPVFLLLVVAVLISCQKEDIPPAASPLTRLIVVNASGDIFNIFQNGNRLNNEASLYPNGVTGYMSIAAGLQNYQFKRMSSPDVLINMPLTLDTIKSYSLYVTGLTADGIFLLNDDFTPDTGAVATVRFVNASPENIELDLSLRNVVDADDDSTVVNTTTITNVAFKSASPFQGAVGGNVELKIFRAGTSTVIAADTVALQNGQGYTIFAKGRLNQTGDTAFGPRLITHQ